MQAIFASAPASAAAAIRRTAATTTVCRAVERSSTAAAAAAVRRGGGCERLALPSVGWRAAGAAATIRRTAATTTVCRASTSVGSRESRGCNVRCCLHRDVDVLRYGLLQAAGDGVRRIPSHHLALEQRDDKVVFEVWQHAAHQVNGALLPTVGWRAAGAATAIRRTAATTTVCRAAERSSTAAAAAVR